MSDRQGPTESATEFPLREAKFGNDNQIWEIIKSGKTKRWKRQTKHTKVIGDRRMVHQHLPKDMKPFTKSYYPASKVSSNCSVFTSALKATTLALRILDIVVKKNVQNPVPISWFPMGSESLL